MALPLHRNLAFPGTAGKLEGILWDVSREAASEGLAIAAVLCHPHPLFGGTMHNKVAYQVAKTIHRFGVPVLRFNFRGVGLSEGAHDEGIGEEQDVFAALDFLAGEYPGAPMLVSGFSFGAWVGLRAGCRDKRVKELIGLGLPVGDQKTRSFSYLEDCDRPKLLASGEFDQFGPPAVLRRIVENLPRHIADNTSLAIVRGGDHFFAGHLAELDHVFADWLVKRHPAFARRQS